MFSTLHENIVLLTQETAKGDKPLIKGERKEDRLREEIKVEERKIKEEIKEEVYKQNILD